MYEEIELEKKAIHYSFSAFSSKPHNPQNQSSPHSNPIKADTGIRQDDIGITYTSTRQPMNVSIEQTHHRGAYYLYSKTKHSTCKCFNQKAQIRVVLYTITSKKRQVWIDEVRELDKNSAKEKQPAKKAPLKENFMKA